MCVFALSCLCFSVESMCVCVRVYVFQSLTMLNVCVWLTAVTVILYLSPCICIYSCGLIPVCACACMRVCVEICSVFFFSQPHMIQWLQNKPRPASHYSCRTLISFFKQLLFKLLFTWKQLLKINLLSVLSSTCWQFYLWIVKLFPDSTVALICWKREKNILWVAIKTLFSIHAETSIWNLPF